MTKEERERSHSENVERGGEIEEKGKWSMWMPERKYLETFRLHIKILRDSNNTPGVALDAAPGTNTCLGDRIPTCAVRLLGT